VLLPARVNSDCDALSNFPSDLKARREKITRYNPTRHPRSNFISDERRSIRDRRSCRCLGKLQTAELLIRLAPLIWLLYAAEPRRTRDILSRAIEKRKSNISGKSIVALARESIPLAGVYG